MPLTPGSVIVREADEPAIYPRRVGRPHVEAPGSEPLTARTGDAVGLYETLADMRLEARVTVAEAGVALRIDDRELFDLLAADVELLQGLFRALLARRVARPCSRISHFVSRRRKPGFSVVKGDRP